MTRYLLAGLGLFLAGIGLGKAAVAGGWPRFSAAVLAFAVLGYVVYRYAPNRGFLRAAMTSPGKVSLPIPEGSEIGELGRAERERRPSPGSFSETR
jgi:hypothetical protein